MPIIIEWPSTIATHAEVWRLLDLSGMTKSVRESRGFTKSGFTYVDGNQVLSLKTQAKIGSTIVLELRFPNGVIKSQEIRPVLRLIRRKARQAGPTVFNRRG